MKLILSDLYERIVKNWQSSVAGVLVLIGLIEWKRQDITTEDFITYLTAVTTILTLLYKPKRA